MAEEAIPEKKLTEKQERFCQAYLIDFNATKAAKEAGYSHETAYSIGHENLSKPEIQVRINELRISMGKSFNVTRERIAQELARIGFSDIRELFNEDGSLKPPNEWPDDLAATVASIETDELFQGVGRDREQIGFTKKVKVWEKVKALEALCKLIGYNAPEKTAFTDPDGNPVQIIFQLPANNREKDSL